MLHRPVKFSVAYIYTLRMTPQLTNFTLNPFFFSPTGLVHLVHLSRCLFCLQGFS